MTIGIIFDLFAFGTNSLRAHIVINRAGDSQCVVGERSGVVECSDTVRVVGMRMN